MHKTALNAATGNALSAVTRERLRQITIISVTFNSAHCIQRLQPFLRDCPQVVFVDNASHDGTVDTIASLLPHATVLCNVRNLGFGAANNRALRQVQTPYALLLNPDCETTPEVIAELVELAHAWPDAAMLAPQLTNAEGRPEINYRWPRSRWFSKGPGAEALCCVGFVTGAIVLLNMRVMQPIGFFDEDFFLYYEDDDLCERVFAQRQPIMIAPHLRAVHHSRGSVKGKSPWRAEYLRGFHHAQSKILFVAKHQSLPRARRLRWRVLLLALLSFPLRCLIPQPKYLARLAGRITGLLQPRWPSPDRHHRP